MKIAFQIFVNLSLLSKELLLAVYMYLERETRVNHTFVLRFFYGVDSRNVFCQI